MGFCNVAAKDIGDGFAVFIGSQEDVDFVPLNSLVRFYGIFQIADVAVFILPVSEGCQTAEIPEGFNAIGCHILNLLPVCGFIVVRGLKNIHEVIHSRTHNQAVLSACQI